MRAAIEWRKARKHAAPAHWADLALDQNTALRKLEIGAGAAAIVAVRVILVLGRSLRQFLLLLRLVFLGFGKSCAATSRRGSDTAYCFDETPPRRSRTRHQTPPLRDHSTMQT